MQQFFAGLDVGSTTVKTVVCSANDRRVLFHKYVRHESHQAGTVLDSLREVKRELSIPDENLRLFMTGSGGQRLAEPLGARFVQEVAAVSSAVETGFPDVRSVIELGGQDAKMIFFQESGDGRRLKKIATMNDKCAGGTGVVIEKIAAKLHISSHDLQTQSYGHSHEMVRTHTSHRPRAYDCSQCHLHMHGIGASSGQRFACSLELRVDCGSDADRVQKVRSTAPSTDLQKRKGE